MALNYGEVIGYSWDAVAVVWLIGYAFTKRTVRVQAVGTRMFHLALLVLGGCMMAGPWFRFGWLAWRFLPNVEWVLIAGTVLTVAGCAFAIWARVTLGANWSARATVKAGHELVTNGPYALARHPIYTGLVTAIAGSALVGGEWRCVLGVAIIVFAFLVKMSQEEQLMMQTFPGEYPEYRRRVKALVPGVF